MASDVKWIKLTTDMFDNRKIKHLRRLPDGNNIVLIWVMLLTMAGRCNAGGMIFLTENIAYTPKMLADELNFEESTVRLALEALEQFNMVVTDANCLRVAGWEEYQNVEGLDKIREQNRLRKAAQRERQKALPASRDCHVTVTQCHAPDIEEESEEDIRNKKENNISSDTVRPSDVQRIIDSWNSLGLNKVKAINPDTSRYAMLRKRLKDYGVDTIVEGVEKIRESSFLQGHNNKGWTVTFDWFIKPDNFQKVLDGNYADKKGGMNRGTNCKDAFDDNADGRYGLVF